MTDGLLGMLRALLPRQCPGCAQPLGSEAGLCRTCRAGLRPRLERHSMLSNAVTPHLVVLGEHKAALRRAARELKYSGHRDLAAVLGKAIASGVPGEWRLRAVSAVPMSATRQRQRHFNHAEVLARRVAAELGLPYQESLKRTRHTVQQAKLSGEARLSNLIGAFSAQSGGLQVRGQITQPLLLVDDVMTTGSTLMACRDALAEVGVDQVFYAVVTR